MAAALWNKIKDSTLLVCLFFLLLSVAYLRNHNNMPGVVWSDTEGYYMYLPAVLIQHSVHHVPPRSMDMRRNQQGEPMMKYTCGVAFFYFPFFIAAHACAHVWHYDTSGFSTPYYYGIMLCGVFWAVVGLGLLLSFLRRYFVRQLAWHTILCIALGTNFFFYATRWMGMAHVYNLVLVAALLLLTDSYYKAPRTKIAIYIGLLFGWLVLIRPTNIVLLLFLLLYRIVSVNDIRERMSFFKGRVKDVAIAIPFFILPLIPQLLYWKEMTGNWVSYSYKGESFVYWRSPKMAAVLFDTQNGWLLYSPVMLLLFIGLVLAKNDKRASTTGTWSTFIIITYIFGSWWAWWFGAAFGHRCYIDYYPVFALPMAIVIERIWHLKKLSLKIPACIAITIFIGYNIGITHVFDHNGIWDGAGWRWNYSLWWSMVRQII